MRRSEYDVSDSIRTTDPAAVASEIIRLARRLFPDAPTPAFERAFADAGRMYRGEHRDYQPCDTGYHDIQHVLDVTLAMARLMDGYQRGGRNGYPALTKELYLVGVLATPRFYDGARKRLEEKLERSYDHAARYFGGPNLYLEEMRKNIDYARTVAGPADVTQRLRRQPPRTLVRP